MKKMLVFLTALVSLLTFFAGTTLAAGGGGGSTEAVAASPYEGPLVLLSLITLAILIYLPIRDHN